MSRRPGPEKDGPGPRPGDGVVIELTGMAHGGEAVGRMTDGRVVFVTGGLPGEGVEVELTEIADRFARGFVAAAPEEPSPARVGEVPCPHFGGWPGRNRNPGAWCGACQWQHAEYTAQLAFKAGIMKDVLTRIGRLTDPPVAGPMGMDEPWGYRNQLRLHSSPAGLGFLGVDGATVVPITSCPIAHALVQELLEVVDLDLPTGSSVTLRAGTRTGDKMVVIHTDARGIAEIDVAADVSVALVDQKGATSVVAGDSTLSEVLGGRQFIIPPTSFFQVNTTMAERMVHLVRESLQPGVGSLIDLHSGVGTFAILASDLADAVYAVERDAASAAAAVHNAAGLEHLTIVEGHSAEALEYVDVSLDAAIADPPRNGIDRATMRLLVDRRPHTIVYVSCEPSTLARDAGHLVAAGWHLESCQPVDMFPQSFHVESVNVFRR